MSLAGSKQNSVNCLLSQGTKINPQVFSELNNCTTEGKKTGTCLARKKAIIKFSVIYGQNDDIVQSEIVYQYRNY